MQGPSLFSRQNSEYPPRPPLGVEEGVKIQGVFVLLNASESRFWHWNAEDVRNGEYVVFPDEIGKNWPLESDALIK